MAGLNPATMFQILQGASQQVNELERMTTQALLQRKMQAGQMEAERAKQSALERYRSEELGIRKKELKIEKEKLATQERIAKGITKSDINKEVLKADADRKKQMRKQKHERNMAKLEAKLEKEKDPLKKQKTEADLELTKARSEKTKVDTSFNYIAMQSALLDEESEEYIGDNPQMASSYMNILNNNPGGTTYFMNLPSEQRELLGLDILGRDVPPRVIGLPLKDIKGNQLTVQDIKNFAQKYNISFERALTSKSIAILKPLSDGTYAPLSEEERKRYLE